MATADLLLRYLHESRASVLMGIVNVTPNSFSDGNLYYEPADAILRAAELVQQGATLLDLGAEASSFFRPGVTAVEPEEQLRRLLPVLGGLWATVLSRQQSGPPPYVSIDTRSALVARRCIEAGAHLINDISAGEHDPEMLRTVAELGCPIVLMHISPGYPANAPTDDPDILETVSAYLRQRIAAAELAGIQRQRILVDPGIGFGKTMADNWRLVLEVDRLAQLGCPVVLGASRKRFLEGWGKIRRHTLLGAAEEVLHGHRHLSEHERDAASAIVTAIGAAKGARVHRVHNVAICAAALGYANALPRPAQALGLEALTAEELRAALA